MFRTLSIVIAVCFAALQGVAMPLHVVFEHGGEAQCHATLGHEDHDGGHAHVHISASPCACGSCDSAEEHAHCHEDHLLLVTRSNEALFVLPALSQGLDTFFGADTTSVVATSEAPPGRAPCLDAPSLRGPPARA